MKTDPLARIESPLKRKCAGCGVIYFAFSAVSMYHTPACAHGAAMRRMEVSR